MQSYTGQFERDVWCEVDRLGQVGDGALLSLSGSLFHYTSPSGLLGILTSNRIWATNVEFFNDTGELRYGMERIQQWLNEHIQQERDRLFAGLLTRTLDELARESAEEIYAVCFCENGDLLSQWRGYGASGTGYAIGLNPEKLQARYRRSPWSSIVVRKIIYRPAEQQRIVRNRMELFYHKLRQAIAGDSDCRDRLAPIAARALAYSLRHLIYCFKHPGFAEENEWRAIFVNTVRRQAERRPVEFRAEGRGIIPYIPLTLAPEAAEGAGCGTAIDRIICGPNTDAKQARNAIRLIMDQTGNGHFEIIASHIAFQRPFLLDRNLQ